MKLYENLMCYNLNCHLSPSNTKSLLKIRVCSWQEILKICINDNNKHANVQNQTCQTIINRIEIVLGSGYSRYSKSLPSKLAISAMDRSAPSSNILSLWSNAWLGIELWMLAKMKRLILIENFEWYGDCWIDCCRHWCWPQFYSSSKQNSWKKDQK